MAKHTLEELEKVEALGFKKLGNMFGGTLAYVQIQRLKKELLSVNQKTKGVKQT